MLCFLLLFYLEGRKTKRDKKRGENFHLLVCSPNVHSSQVEPVQSWEPETLSRCLPYGWKNTRVWHIVRGSRARHLQEDGPEAEEPGLEPGTLGWVVCISRDLLSDGTASCSSSPDFKQLLHQTLFHSPLSYAICFPQLIFVLFTIVLVTLSLPSEEYSMPFSPQKLQLKQM